MRRLPLLWFFALAYGFSWAFWLPAAASHAGLIGPVPTALLHLLGGLGPLLSSLVMTRALGGRDALTTLLRRFVRGGRWLVLGAALPAVLFLIAIAGIAAFTRAPLDWSAVGSSTEMPELPRPLFWLANIVFYGFGEEAGWRGFALPRFQARTSALRASLYVTFGWAAWHLPLFVFSPGLSSLGIGGAFGWLLSLYLGAILMTWLFNSSCGSIGAVALFHAVLDIFITSPVTPLLSSVMGALLTVGSIAVVPIFGAENLARRPRVQSSS